MAIRRFHYAWVVVVVTFLVLLLAAGVRALPSVMIKPLEAEFGWDRAQISFAVALSLFAYGFGGPISGSLVDRFGPRRVMLAGLAITSVGLVPMLAMTNLWQLYLLWGVVVGVGTGTISNVIAATVANRWFNTHRGLAIGLLGASTAAGQLVLFPTMVSLASHLGWRVPVALAAGMVAVMLIPAVFLMRNRPEDIGAEPFGGKAKQNSPAADSETRATPLSEAIRTRDFWLLAGSFFICGYTTNGLIQTHLLPHALEHGFVETAAAGAVALMGLMNIFGTLASGWLTDRYDNRKLLATYYGLRALSLVALPFIAEMNGLLLFAVVYGLDWVATVPPTVNLTAKRFGRASLGTLYGWIFCSHMIGAGIGAQAGGIFRDLLGDYHVIFLSAAVMGFIAASLVMQIGDQREKAAIPEPQAAG